MVTGDGGCPSPSDNSAAKVTAARKLAEPARESSCSPCPVSSGRFLPWLFETDNMHK